MDIPTLKVTVTTENSSRSHISVLVTETNKLKNVCTNVQYGNGTEKHDNTNSTNENVCYDNS